MTIYTNRSLWLRLTAAGLVASLSTGCGYLLQARDNAVPTAVPSMRYAQTLNPEAGKNRKVVAGLDGNAAQNVSDSYANSFERKAETDSTASFQGLEGLGSD